MDAGAIDEQVRALVRSHRPELERLVDQVLEAELATLVAERLAARNGAAPALCTVCGERAPQPHRKVCETCRSRQRRQRTATSAQEPASDDTEPRPAPAIAPAKRRPRVGRLPRSRYDRARAAERRQLIDAAPVEHVEIGGRTWTIRRLPPQPFPRVAG